MEDNKMESGRLLQMQPLDLLSLLQQETRFPKLEKLETEDDYKTAAELLNCAASFICYFREMETAARIVKRKAKRDKKPLEEQDRCIGVEEVFETFKKISEQQYDVITRMFTSKRLSFEEMKAIGKTI